MECAVEQTTGAAVVTRQVAKRDAFVRMKAEWHALDAEDSLSNPMTDTEIMESCALADRRDAMLRQIMTTPTDDLSSILDKLDLLGLELQREQVNGVGSADGRELLMLAAIRPDVIALHNRMRDGG